MNKILAGLSILALAAGSWACDSGDDDDAPGPSPGSQGALVCAEARQALDAMQTEGRRTSTRPASSTPSYTSSTASAPRTPSWLLQPPTLGTPIAVEAAEAVGAALTNMVQTCAQEGY
jgi:hypothetical protein